MTKRKVNKDGLLGLVHVATLRGMSDEQLDRLAGEARKSVAEAEEIIRKNKQQLKDTKIKLQSLVDVRYYISQVRIERASQGIDRVVSEIEKAKEICS